MNPMKNPVHKIKTADITEMDALHRMRGYRRCPDKSEDKAVSMPAIFGRPGPKRLKHPYAPA